MELKVKNLASSDSKGYDLQKEVLVKVTHHGTHEVRPHRDGTQEGRICGDGTRRGRIRGDTGYLYQLQPPETQSRAKHIPSVSWTLGNRGIHSPVPCPGSSLTAPAIPCPGPSLAAPAPGSLLT